MDGIAVLGYLVQIGFGEETRVRHQTLVYRAELVDAEFGVGDEAAVLAPGLLAEQQVAKHPLERRIPEAGLVDQRGRLGQEQVGPQAVEDQSGLLAVLRLRRLVSPVDERKQPGERVVQVRAVHGARSCQLDQRQVAEPVETVSLVVLLRADRQHLELGDASA